MISGGSLLKLWKNTISLRSFSGRQVFHWHVDLSPWSSQHLHLFSFFPLLLDLYQRFQILAGNSQVLHHFTGVETSAESAQILFMVEQNSSKFFTRAWLTFFFCFLFLCMLFVFLLLSVTICHCSWKTRQGGQFGVFSGAERRPRPPALMSCEISFQAGLQTVSQVCRVCRNIHLLHSHIFFFLTSCLLRQKEESDKFSLSTIGNTGPFLTLALYLLSWLTPVGLQNQDQGLALKMIDSNVDGSCRNMGESWQMRIFQPQKLLPCCKFYKPTRKREQRLL